MKLIFVLAAALSTACAASVQPKEYPDYTRSSGIALDSLDARNPQVVENLGLVCRVWGYVKYHHPAFDTPVLDADCELFGLLPRVAKAAPGERNAALYDWVRGLGPFTTDRAELDEALKELQCVETANLSWTRDTTQLGTPLSELLQELRYAKREKNRYTDFTPTGNFSMEGESTLGSLDDCGYRLLHLFRFWNVIEYFSPNRNLTDTPWSEIPEKYIPLFIPAPSTGYPETCQLGPNCAIRTLRPSNTTCTGTNPFPPRCAMPTTGSSSRRTGRCARGTRFFRSTAGTGNVRTTDSHASKLHPTTKTATT